MSNLSDVVSGAHLFGGSSYSFVPDRFCSPNSAIYFNQGYLQVPEGVYFSGDFTFTAWIYLKSYQLNSRIFEFGNGQPNDNVALSMSRLTNRMYVFTFIGPSISQFEASAIINLNEWYFVAFVLSGTTGYIYVNGNQVTTGTLYVPINIIRRNNNIGKSNWNEPNADAIYDELKIYQGALSSADIMNEYKLNSNECIINYWPMSNLNDIVGEANLFGGANYSFVPDRRCSANSAIYFNQGYLQVPEGVYFSGDFTFTAWIYLKSYQSNSRIFDFGNGQQNDNVYLSMYGLNSKLESCIYKGSTYLNLFTSQLISLNEWYFISFVLSGTTGYIYLNGNQTVRDTLLVPNNVSRTNNYIGKDNWASVSYADAIYDEFKIYKVALSSADIMNEYQISSNNG